MKYIRVTPAEGVRVRNPDNAFTHLPAEGETVRSSPYWLRMIRDGAVIKSDLSTKE